MLCEQVLGKLHDFDTTGKTVEYVDIEWHEAFKKIHKKKTDKDKEYSILLTDTTMSVLKKINPECEIRRLGNTTLSSAWTAAMENGQQPSAPEDYIEVEK